MKPHFISKKFGSKNQFHGTSRAKRNEKHLDKIVKIVRAGDKETERESEKKKYSNVVYVSRSLVVDPSFARVARSRSLSARTSS